MLQTMLSKAQVRVAPSPRICNIDTFPSAPSLKTKFRTSGRWVAHATYVHIYSFYLLKKRQLLNNYPRFPPHRRMVNRSHATEGYQGNTNATVTSRRWIIQSWSVQKTVVICTHPTESVILDQKMGREGGISYTCSLKRNTLYFLYIALFLVERGRNVANCIFVRTYRRVLDPTPFK